MAQLGPEAIERDPPRRHIRDDGVAGRVQLPEVAGPPQGIVARERRRARRRADQVTDPGPGPGPGSDERPAHGTDDAHPLHGMIAAVASLVWLGKTATRSRGKWEET